MIKSWASLVEETGADPVQALSKAMSTTGISGGDATPLRIEDLDSTMTSVLYKRQEFVLYNWIRKTPAMQIDWQYNKRLSYGSTRQAPGFREGLGPSGRNSVFQRKTAVIKYMGMKGGYTLQDSRVGQAGGQVLTPEQIENEDTTIELLKSVEQWIFWGSAAIKDNSGASVNYDGIYEQVVANAPTNVIDLKGAPLTTDILELHAEKLRTEAFVTDFSEMVAFMSPHVLSSFSNTLQGSARERITAGQGGFDGKLGHPVAGYVSNFGYIPFKDSIWLQRSNAPLTVGAGETPPGTLTSLAGVAVIATAAGTKFTEAGDAATYYYWVAAVGDGGESVAMGATAGGLGISVAVPANGAADLTITRTANNLVTHYTVYRSTVNDITTAREIARVPSANGGGNATFRDLNGTRPGTGVVALLNNNTENLVIPQLMPLMKLPQPLQLTTQPFFLLLYHTMVVRAAERQKIFVNVGRASVSG